MTLTGIALDVDVGKEVHLDLDDAVPLAGLTAAALDVEGEAAGLVTTRFGFRETGEPVADRREGARVGGRVRARRAADGRLINVDDLIDAFQTV